MIHPEQLVRYVIRPTIEYLGMGSRSAELLLLGTALAESEVNGRTCLRQLGNGPAIGIYQMEKNTANYLIDDWLPKHKSLYDKMLTRFETAAALPDRMTGDLYLATALARLFYWRVPTALPGEDDINGLAQYWKDHWNTYLGKGHPSTFVTRLKQVL